MKTRIISAAVMIAFVIAVLFTGYKYNTFIITAFISLLSAAATYEILHTIVKTGTVIRKAAACVYAVAAFFSISGILRISYDALIKSADLSIKLLSRFIVLLLFSTVFYVVFFTVSVIVKNREFDLKEIFALLGAPFMYSAAFSALLLQSRREYTIYCW